MFLTSWSSQLLVWINLHLFVPKYRGCYIESVTENTKNRNIRLWKNYIFLFNNQRKTVTEAGGILVI